MSLLAFHMQIFNLFKMYLLFSMKLLKGCCQTIIGQNICQFFVFVLAEEQVNYGTVACYFLHVLLFVLFAYEKHRCLTSCISEENPASASTVCVARVNNMRIWIVRVMYVYIVWHV